MQLFKVDGMRCGHCIKAITDAIKTADAQAQVEVDLASAEVRVDSILDATQLGALISKAGYAAHLQ
ncbi:heavy-metal-associated domain-containing protein [Pseudomonas sp. S9]|uniref:heavy-metal-associated domain-containing protein n=1 Tax=Pseudomonas sp. S9 TaxID=686578 RepID=UPI00025574FF|nr:heavy-metal-associated domain-containing protein [Pseudomonas sp. S9]